MLRRLGGRYLSDGHDFVRRCMVAVPTPAATAPSQAPQLPATPPWDQPASGYALTLDTLSAGAHEVRCTQSGREYCVAYSAALAVHWRHPLVCGGLRAVVRGSSSVDEETAVVSERRDPAVCACSFVVITICDLAV